MSGERGEGCPWRAACDPFVGAVIRAHRWWKNGELASKWPHAPAALVAGIEAFDCAINAIELYDVRNPQPAKAVLPSAPLPRGTTAPLPQRPSVIKRQ